MKIDKTLIITSVICLLPIVLGVLLYDRLPALMPVHFNFVGDPDSWGPKVLVVVGLPVFLCLLNILCNVSTRKYGGENQSMLVKFCRWLCAIISIVIVPVILFKALGADIPIQSIAPVLVGIVFIIIGNYSPKTKLNPVVGVRIKWTLESEENWRRTHRFAGYLWMICGFVMIVNAFLVYFYLSYLWVAVFFGVIIAMIAAPIIYSYYLHRKGV